MTPTPILATVRQWWWRVLGRCEICGGGPVVVGGRQTPRRCERCLFPMTAPIDAVAAKE